MQYIGPTIIIIYDVYNLGKLERPHCNRTLEVMMDKGNHSLLWPYGRTIQVRELL